MQKFRGKSRGKGWEKNMWSESFVEGYIRNIRLFGKHNVTAYSICPSQSYFKISIRGRINFISLHGCRSKSLFFLDMRQNFCSFNCTVVLKIAVVKSWKLRMGCDHHPFDMDFWFCFCLYIALYVNFLQIKPYTFLCMRILHSRNIRTC